MRRYAPFVPRLLSPVLLLALGAACGGGDAGGDAPQRRFLSMGAAPPGGAFFVVGSALAEVLNETGGELGYSVTAEATSGA